MSIKNEIGREKRDENCCDRRLITTSWGFAPRKPLVHFATELASFTDADTDSIDSITTGFNFTHVRRKG